MPKRLTPGIRVSPPKPPEIDDDEYVVTAYGETAAGPGWSNQPLWVILRNSSGRIRQIAIQPEQQTADMIALYAVSNVVHRQMAAAVKSYLKRYDP